MSSLFGQIHFLNYWTIVEKFIHRMKPNKTNKEALGVEGYKLQQKECEREEMNEHQCVDVQQKRF